MDSGVGEEGGLAAPDGVGACGWEPHPFSGVEAVEGSEEAVFGAVGMGKEVGGLGFQGGTLLAEGVGGKYGGSGG